MKSFILRLFPHQKARILEIKRELAGLLVNFHILFLKYFKKEKLVTILGCCRQDSIASIFVESQIRNDLTYTHSTKEVLQTINYLNDLAFQDFSRYSFRTAQIAGRFAKRKRLMRQWRLTDVVVVEISSLKYYLKNGIEYHHEVYDNPEGLSPDCIRYINEDPGELIEKFMSQAELLEDLSEIVKKLGSKKIVFATNFITRTKGTRYTIHSALKNFCRERDFQYIDTHEIFNHWKIQEILIEEPILAHLSKLGHEIMANRYQQAIMSTFESSSSLKVLIAKYVSYPRTENIYGLGDYLYGVMYLFQLANLKPKKFLLKVDYSQSSLAPFLQKVISPSLLEPKYLFHEARDRDFLTEKEVFTNKRPVKPITPACRDFVLRNALPLDQKSFSKVNWFLENYGLYKRQYTVLHVRLGDSGLLDIKDPGHISIAKVVNELNRVILNFEETRQYILVVDSVTLRNQLSRSGLKVTNGLVAHTGFALNQDVALENTLMEFFLLMNSEKIIQFSAHSWGSGFSESAALLAGIPLDRISLT